MAALSITAANVAKVAGATTETLTAGATITAGQLVYKDASDSDKAKLADANASQAAADAYGVALNGATAGQPITVLTAGDYTVGATVAVGAIYLVSDEAGGIEIASELTTGWYTKVWMIARTTTIATVINRGPSTLVPAA